MVNPTLDQPTVGKWAAAIVATNSQPSNWVQIQHGQAPDPMADLMWAAWKLGGLGDVLIASVYNDLNYYFFAKMQNLPAGTTVTTTTMTQGMAEIRKLGVASLGVAGQICVSNWQPVSGAC
jgi:hypothetical protein